MKKILLALALSLPVSLIYAQEKIILVKDVPVVTASSFKDTYHTEKVEWRKSGKEYEASFEDHGIWNYVVYNGDGKVVRKEVALKDDALPVASNEYIKTAYGAEQVHHVRRVTDADGKITYKGDVKDATLYFDENGKFLRSEKADKS